MVDKAVPNGGLSGFPGRKVNNPNIGGDVTRVNALAEWRARGSPEGQGPRRGESLGDPEAILVQGRSAEHAQPRLGRPELCKPRLGDTGAMEKQPLQTGHVLQGSHSGVGDARVGQV